jgi:hypothetical protein
MNKNQLIILKHSIFACLQQGKPSYYISNNQDNYPDNYPVGCRYNIVGDDSSVLKCSVGHLIHNTCYIPEIESRSVSSVCVVDALKKSASIIFDKSFTKEYNEELLSWLGVLQKCHDRFADKHSRGEITDSEWVNTFRKELSSYFLLLPFLNEWDSEQVEYGIA